jgi:hypothetical protein
MSRFVSAKEIALINSVTEEIIEDFLSMTIVVYKVNPEFSEFDDVNGESANKAFDPGLQIACLVRFLEPEVSTTGEDGVSQIRQIEAYIHKKHLTDKSMYFDEGDYVFWDDQYFEVKAISEPQIFDGLPTNKIMVKIECEGVGLSSINILEREIY